MGHPGSVASLSLHLPAETTEAAYLVISERCA